MGNKPQKGSPQDYYPTMDHYASGGGKRKSSKRLSRKQKDLMNERRSSLNNKRNTPRTPVTSGSGRRSFDNFKDLEMPPVHNRPRQRSEGSNRYEGLGEVSRLSSTARRRNMGSNRVRQGSVSLVKGDREIMLDLDPHKDIPPPPPSWDDVEKDLLETNAGKHTADDLDYIDYTVIPLLIRADMDYAEAQKFGNILKLNYTGKQIRNFMQNPFPLFAIMEKEGISINDDMKFKIVEDDYWKELKTGEKTRGNSFVYYRDSTGGVKQKRKTPTKEEKKTRRGSVKMEFDQEFTGNNNKSDFQFDMTSFRKSLEIMGEEFERDLN